MLCTGQLLIIVKYLTQAIYKEDYLAQCVEVRGWSWWGLCWIFNSWRSYMRKSLCHQTKESETGVSNSFWKTNKGPKDPPLFPLKCPPSKSQLSFLTLYILRNSAPITIYTVHTFKAHTNHSIPIHTYVCLCVYMYYIHKKKTCSQMTLWPLILVLSFDK